MAKIQPIRNYLEYEEYRDREEQRERQALAAFYRRESLRKVPMHITGMQVFWWCVFTLGVAAVLIYTIVGS